MENKNQITLPNSTGVLVLGIISIPTCFCFGVVGLICSVIALILSAKGSSLYKSNPESYTLQSFNNLKAGKICAIIGLVLSIINIAYFIFTITVLGNGFEEMQALPWEQMMEQSQQNGSDPFQDLDALQDSLGVIQDSLSIY